MNKILLAIVMVVILSITAQAQVISTKLEYTPVWNDVNTFISTTAQTVYGQDTTVKAIARDISEGHAAILPRGTRVGFVEKVGNVCFITVEGVSGFWCTHCEVLE
jgi:hypothetical protein